FESGAGRQFRRGLRCRLRAHVLARAVLLASIIVVATAPSAWPFTIADMGGRALTLPAPPQRIISLVPSVTELIFALGGQDRFVARIRAVAAAVAAAPRPRVLYVLWPEPLIVPGRDAIVTELIGLAGGDSITANERNDYPRYSVEAAVAHAPEVIILARHGTGSGPIARDQRDRLVSRSAY